MRGAERSPRDRDKEEKPEEPGLTRRQVLGGLGAAAALTVTLAPAFLAAVGGGGGRNAPKVGAESPETLDFKKFFDGKRFNPAPAQKLLERKFSLTGHAEEFDDLKKEIVGRTKALQKQLDGFGPSLEGEDDKSVVARDLLKELQGPARYLYDLVGERGAGGLLVQKLSKETKDAFSAPRPVDMPALDRKKVTDALEAKFWAIELAKQDLDAARTVFAGPLNFLIQKNDLVPELVAAVDRNTVVKDLPEIIAKTKEESQKLGSFLVEFERSGLMLYFKLSDSTPGAPEPLYFVRDGKTNLDVAFGRHKTVFKLENTKMRSDREFPFVEEKPAVR